MHNFSLHERWQLLSRNRSPLYSVWTSYLKAVDKSAGQCGSKGWIVKELGIATMTLSTAIKDRQKIQASFEQADFEPEWKRMRTYPYKEVEDALLIRFKSQRNRAQLI